MTTSLDKGISTDVTYLNLRKAFDTVPCTILVHNLRGIDKKKKKLSG